MCGLLSATLNPIRWRLHPDEFDARPEFSRVWFRAQPELSVLKQEHFEVVQDRLYVLTSHTSTRIGCRRQTVQMAQHEGRNTTFERWTSRRRTLMHLAMFATGRAVL